MQDWKKYFQPKRVFVTEGPSFYEFVEYPHYLMHTRTILGAVVDESIEMMQSVTIKFHDRPSIPPMFLPYIKVADSRIEAIRSVVSMHEIGSQIQSHYPYREELIGSITFHWHGRNR